MVNKHISKAGLMRRISKGRDKLLVVSSQLKNHFVGLDNIIDKIINNIEIWYIMPELLTRPIIINLWGLTGVGKTDLVRRLVKGLDFSDRFVEIQLTNKGTVFENFNSTIESVLSYSNLEATAPGILLLDEMQRFRSINEDGKEIHDYKFQDVWTLLSDGRFGGDVNNRDRILQIMFEAMYWQDYAKYEEFDEDDTNEPSHTDSEDPQEVSGRKPKSIKQRSKHRPKRKFNQNYFEAKQLKKMLKLEDSVEEIMAWDAHKQNELLLKKLDDPDIYEGEDYSKLLIFISGNLDEAYDMAHNCEDADVDADVFHEHSLNINLVTIKQALKDRFKPEQIARFGNTHIIYPSLSKASYREIARRGIKCLTDDVRTKYGISIYVEQSIHDLIYRNGVFPVQGTRPLFSTISSLLENVIPRLLFNAIRTRSKSIKIYYEDNNICAKINNKTYKSYFEGDIDVIRKDKNKDNLVGISVHEAGHAVVYALLFNLAPVQLTSKTSSAGIVGFLGSHYMVESYSNHLKNICVNMSGLVAEEIVFGDERKMSVASEDIFNATSIAGHMVRAWGFSSYASKIIPEGATDTRDYSFMNLNNMPSNDVIEDIVKKEKQKANTILRSNLPLLKAVSDKLIAYGFIECIDFQCICKDFSVDVDIVEAKKFICNGYADTYDNFFSQEGVSEIFVSPEISKPEVIISQNS